MVRRHEKNLEVIFNKKVLRLCIPCVAQKNQSLFSESQRVIGPRGNPTASHKTPGPSSRHKCDIADRMEDILSLLHGKNILYFLLIDHFQLSHFAVLLLGLSLLKKLFVQ